MANFLQQLIGTKPTVPDLPSLSLSNEQQKALAANIAAIPGTEQIATQVDLFNQQQVDKMLENVIPNYKAITGQISSNIAAMTSGQIPTDVSQQIQRADAARALGGGFAGTQAQGNLTARDLGLTSLDLTQRGLASAQSWLQTANSLYSPGQFNVSSMFVSPAQQAQFDVQERDAQFQTQWMKNQIAAMPAPWASDLKQFVYRALSAYSGTSVPNDPYQTPGSFGSPNLGGDNFSFGGSYSPGAGEGGAGFDSEQTFLSDQGAGGGLDFGDSGGGGGGGGIAAMLA